MHTPTLCKHMDGRAHAHTRTHMGAHKHAHARARFALPRIMCARRATSGRRSNCAFVFGSVNWQSCTLQRMLAVLIVLLDVTRSWTRMPRRKQDTVTPQRITQQRALRNALQHVATQYSSLHTGAARCDTVHHARTQCITLQHSASRCNTVHHAATDARTCASKMIGVSGHGRSGRRTSLPPVNWSESPGSSSRGFPQNLHARAIADRQLLPCPTRCGVSPVGVLPAPPEFVHEAVRFLRDPVLVPARDGLGGAVSDG